MIAQELEVSLHMAFMDARQKRHEFISVEHLLLAMLDNPSAVEVLRACGANIEAMREQFPGERIRAAELRQFSIFAELDAEELDSIAEISHVQEFETGEELTAEGAEAERLYLFLKGKAYYITGQDDKALSTFREIIDRYAYAQSWDPRGWFWKPRAADTVCW